MLFREKDISVVGIDIGTASIKAVCVTRNGDKLTLNNYNEIYFAPYVGKNVGEYVRLGREELSNVINDAYNELKVKSDMLVIGLPASACIFRVISISKSAQNQVDRIVLENVIRFEFKRVTPHVNVDSYTFTFSEIVSSEKYTDYLVLAIHNEYLSDVDMAARRIGVDYVMQPNIFGGIRLLPQDLDENVIVINIGANNINVAFINSHKLVGVENINEGMNKLIFNVRNTDLIDYNSARDKVLSFDYNSDDSLASSASIKLSTESTINQIIHILNSYELRYNIKYSKVYVGGSSAKITNTESFYRKILNREVVVVKPFERVSMPQALQSSIADDSSVFMNALGLAISSIN